ncbi:unnamed protein product, partial [marine sediment metagenome]
DGTQAGNYTDTDATFIVTQVGRFWDNSNYTYEGSVDDLRLYDRVLNTEEVDTIMNFTGPGLAGDINGDGKVNIEDFAELAEQWLWSGSAGAVDEDIVEDGSVDFIDFAELANQWLN